MHVAEDIGLEIIQALPEHIAVLDASARIVLTNRAWELFAAENGAAHDPKVSVGANYLDACQRAVDVGGDPYAATALQGIQSVLDARAPSFAMDYPCHSPREQRWFSMTAVALKNTEKARALIAHSNVTSRTLAAKEMSHRFKNLLNLVQAIADQTMRAAPDDFSDRFSDRLQALARTQDLLADNSWHHVPLRELVNSELGHFAGYIGDRIAVEGLSILVSPRAAQALGMALHELGTNAVKYGALASATGRIFVTWNVEPLTEQFTMDWLEQGGPPVINPHRPGFGTSIVAVAVERSLNATVTLQYHVSGLHWTVKCDAHNIRSGGADYKPRPFPAHRS